MEGTRGLRDFFGLKRNLVLLLIAIVAIGAGEETWMRFVPKYLESLGAAALVIGLYDGLKTLLGAVYAYPGGAVVDRWGHRRGLVAFTGISIAGYLLVLLVPRWPAVIGGDVSVPGVEHILAARDVYAGGGESLRRRSTLWESGCSR